jgi:hypothetical protein
MTETTEDEVADIERAYRSELPVALVHLWSRLGELQNIADRLAATCADPVAVDDYLAWTENRTELRTAPAKRREYLPRRSL